MFALVISGVVFVGTTLLLRLCIWFSTRKSPLLIYATTPQVYQVMEYQPIRDENYEESRSVLKGKRSVTEFLGPSFNEEETDPDALKTHLKKALDRIELQGDWMSQVAAANIALYDENKVLKKKLKTIQENDRDSKLQKPLDN